MGYLAWVGRKEVNVEACAILQLQLPLSALISGIKSLSGQGAGSVCYFLGQVSLHPQLDGSTLSLPFPHTG